MFIDPEFESFIELYSPGKTFTFARNNMKEHTSTGAIGAWIVSLIGYLFYCIGIFTRGWISISVLALGTPLLMGWAIYSSRTPMKSGQRQHIKDKLNEYHYNLKIKDLMDYLSTHYTFDTALMTWRKGLGVFFFILWLGYFLGILGSRDRDF